MRRFFIAVTLAVAVFVPARPAAAATMTTRHAPFDKGCLAVFEPNVVVGCVAPLPVAKYGRLSGTSHPAVCAAPVVMPHACRGDVAAMALIKLRRVGVRSTPRVSVEGHRLAGAAVRPQLCVVLLHGTPLTSVWGNCTRLDRVGRTTVRLREDLVLAKGEQFWVGVAVLGNGAGQVDRIRYSIQS